MKVLKVFIACLVFANSFAQDESDGIGIEKKFFNTTNFKVAMSLGVDGSWAGDNGKTRMIIPNGNIKKDKLFFGSSINLNVGLDFYAADSKLGFFIDPTLNISNYSITQPNAALRDSISSTNLEIPLYLKLRLGNPLSKSHFWWALGAGYSIPLKTEQNFIEKSSNSIIATLKEKDMYKPVPYLSTLIGYELIVASKIKEGKELYDRDDFRFLFFLKANYDLDNRINTDFNFGSDTSLGNISDPNLQFLRISFGVKILFRFSKAGYVLNEVSKNIK
jgi:hypothetical protein